MANPMAKTQKKENPLISIIVNIAIPIYVLNKMTVTLGPIKALLIALAFPLIYSIYFFILNRKMDLMSGFGLLNTLVSGGLALVQLEGIWFAIKEAAFPALLGAYFYYTSFSKETLFSKMFMNEQLLKLDLIQIKLQELGRENLMKIHLKKCTQYFSYSFFVSAILNFVVAMKVFTPIDMALAEEQRAALLNEQLAKMQGLGFTVIMIPSIICTMAVLWYFFKGLNSLTNLKTAEFIQSGQNT
jgi:hypothetical protein